LRERKTDIPLLVRRFMEKHSAKANRQVSGISESAVNRLIGYNWPGNIRELENVIERAVVLSRGVQITVEDLPDFLSRGAEEEPAPQSSHSLKEALRSPERDIILKVLNSVEWNRNSASKALGINRTTLYKKMLRYGLIKSRRIPSQDLPVEELRQEITE
jgi:transcriptional regulator with PAS, ATPase and Fis domain